jgi:hypothetical protein
MATLRACRAALVGTALGTAILAAPVASASPSQPGAPGHPTAPCYNGVFPLNPYVDNCALPSRPPRVLGSAPDQTALLNCNIGSEALRAQCLSLYVNGGYGWYPGATLVPGYRP